MTKRHPKLVQALISLVLVALGVGLALYIWQDALTAALVRANTTTVTTTTVKKAQTQTASANYDFDAVKPLSLAGLSQATVQSRGISAVGKLVIPEVKMNLPIALGVDNATLAFAAGTLNAKQTMGKGNYALAGHHIHSDESLLFGPLTQTAVGNLVYVTDMTTVYAYQIYARRYIQATQVDVLNETTSPTLTLITCDDDGTGRLLVQARLVGHSKVTQLDSALQKQIAAD